LSLRLRALLGVSARAEIVRVLLARPGTTLTALDLVKEDVGYTKRAIRDALEDLRVGGIVELVESGNRNGYSPRISSGFAGALGSEGLFFPRWRPLFAVLRGLLDLLERIETFRPATRPIEIRRSLKTLHHEIRDAGLRAPFLPAGSDGLHELGEWSLSLLHALAQGEQIDLGKLAG
jgi:hypothetical protein